MGKKENGKNRFPPPALGFGGSGRGESNFDPLGSYTGNASNKDEIPVQDADDL